MRRRGLLVVLVCFACGGGCKGGAGAGADSGASAGSGAGAGADSGASAGSGSGASACVGADAGAGAGARVSAPAGTGTGTGTGTGAPAGGIPCDHLEPEGTEGSTCAQFDSPRDAFLYAIAGDPLVLAMGEVHAPAGATVPSAARRFTDELLPLLAGRASDLLLELMMPPSACQDAAAEVRRIEQPVTSRHAETAQDEYVTMGEHARTLGIVPDMLRPTCADMDAIRRASHGQGDFVDVALEMTARLSRVQAARLVDRDALSDADRGKMVVLYGGALHNALAAAFLDVRVLGRNDARLDGGRRAMRDGLLAAAEPSASWESHDGGRRAMRDGLLAAAEPSASWESHPQPLANQAGQPNQASQPASDGAARWSYAPELYDHVQGRFVAIDLVVPEFVGDGDSFRSLAWWPLYDSLRHSPKFDAKTTLFSLRRGDVQVLVFPRASPR